MPFKAWKMIKAIAVPVLHAVAVQLVISRSTLVSNDNPFFNEAFLTCLGKKTAFVQDGIGSVSSATRPLSVVNADNRLIASSVLKKASAKIEPWVSSNQRGFIKGRSMLQNIIEIDEPAMRISLGHPDGALVLFDFEAAFPSLAHSCLWEALNALGLQ